MAWIVARFVVLCISLYAWTFVLATPSIWDIVPVCIVSGVLFGDVLIAIKQERV